MTARPDLMHLSPEALAHATNAGVVKRAVRELEGGYRPQWSLDDAATLTARFSDGIVTSWPQGKPINQTACSCGAASVCRHRIVAALVFREEAAHAAEGSDAPSDTVSPGQVSETVLASVIPASFLEIARQELAHGLSVEVRRVGAGEPCDTARLPSSTIRFWAGAAIEAARCDCIRGAACEHVALAVWAYRKADAEHPGTAAIQVRLGSEGACVQVDAAPYRALVEELLRHGVAQGPAPMARPLSLALDAARASGARWLDYLLADLERWSASYAKRSALYQPTEGVDLVAELSLRLSAGSLAGNARNVLGIGLPGETELERLRLMCIGARTLRDGEQRSTRLVLADGDTGTRMVLVKQWSVPEGEFANEAAIRASERLAPGVRLEQMAQGQLLAQQAKRLADGSLKLAKSRSSQNSVLPQAADWDRLTAPLRLSSVAQLIQHKQGNPTAQLLPRHAAGQFVIFTPHDIERLSYDPNEQTLTAIVCDQDERRIVVRRTYENHLRNALDAIAGAFTGHHGRLRHVAGILHWVQGLPVIEPWALACDSVVVPDFAAACGALAAVPIGQAPFNMAPSVSRALQNLRQLVSVLLHHGVIRLPRSWAHDSSTATRQLRALSLHTLAQRAEAFAAEVLQAQAKAASSQLAAALMELLALLQLHEDAQVIAGFEGT